MLYIIKDTGAGQSGSVEKTITCGLLRLKDGLSNRVNSVNQ